MDKLKMHTTNKADENFKKLAEMFPNAVTEMIDEKGEVVRAIDKDILMQEINRKVVEGSEERYQFTWPDKKKTMLLANAPINKTLRPCREESVNFDNTENLYIEGDNLEVLKLLQETYLGKVKMIYIDPPYNTGNDFIYEDDFTQSREEYSKINGDYDEEGNRLVKNLESNGRFHTDWLNMMYPRLKIARDLLSDDGVIFISIDDNEQSNLKKICDEIFGANNFVTNIIWERAFSPINLMKHFSTSHDFMVCYAKNIELAKNKGIIRNEEADNRYKNPDNDPRGVWQSSDLSVGPAVESNIYKITTPSGRVVEPLNGRSWRISEKVFYEKLKDNRIWFGSDGNGVPRLKRFLSELRKSGITPMTIWKYSEVGHSQSASKSLKELFDGKMFFDYPKPVDLIKRAISLYINDGDIILDFFSGSGTTAHAVMKLNAEDGSNLKFIMVQIPELTDEKSEAYKAGYKNICEIGKERIRRAAKKISEEYPESSFDSGFRVLKCDSSNMKDVYYEPENYDKNNLLDLVDNIKEDRTEEDLLFQVILDLGIDLSSKIEEEIINGKKVFNVENGFLYACFDSGVDEKLIESIARKKPYYAIFRDSGMNDDSSITNFEQIFSSISPSTIRKVL